MRFDTAKCPASMHSRSIRARLLCPATHLPDVLTIATGRASLKSVFLDPRRLKRYLEYFIFLGKMIEWIVIFFFLKRSLRIKDKMKMLQL